MMHTSPWADIMGNPQWPDDIKNLRGKHNNSAIAENIDEEDDISDDGITEDEDGAAEFTISDVEVEEDEVDQLLTSMMIK
jgi:hypothetical protein